MQMNLNLAMQMNLNPPMQTHPKLVMQMNLNLTMQKKLNLAMKQTSTWQCKWTLTWLCKWTLIWQCKWTLTWPCKWTVTWQCKRTLAITLTFPALPILVMAIILIITYMGMCVPRDFLVLMPAVLPCSHWRLRMICHCASLRWLLSAQWLACNSTSCPRMQNASYPFCMSYLWPCLCQTLRMFLLFFFCYRQFLCDDIHSLVSVGFSHEFIYEWLYLDQFVCCCNLMFYDWCECVISTKHS